MAKTATAQEIKISDEPKSLKAAMLIIELARTTIETLTEERDEANEKIAELEGEVSELNETLETAEADAGDMETALREMVCILAKLKSGAFATAASDLDRLICRTDHGAKARTSTVPVLL